MRFRIITVSVLAVVACFFVLTNAAVAQRPRGETDAECTARNAREGHPRTCVSIYSRGESSGSSDESGSGRGWRDRDRPDRDYSNPSESRGSTANQPSGNRARGRGGSVTIATPDTVAALNQRFALLRQLNGNWAFANMVANGNGVIPLSVVRDLKPNANPMSISYTLLTKAPDANGHHYLTVNYLGRGLDIDAAWRLVTQHLADVFPMNRVSGPSGPIAMGNRYNLVIGGVPYAPTFVFPVTVTAVSPYTFTFTAGQEHWLQGSATHGIVKDSNGDVWLFEEGVGVPNEPMQLQIMNYAIADSMWARMASNIRSQLGR